VALVATTPTRSTHRAANPMASATTACLGRLPLPGTEAQRSRTAASDCGRLLRSAVAGMGAPTSRTMVAVGRTRGVRRAPLQLAGTDVPCRQHADATAGHMQESAVARGGFPEADRRIVEVEAVRRCRQGCHDGASLLDGVIWVASARRLE